MLSTYSAIVCLLLVGGECYISTKISGNYVTVYDDTTSYTWFAALGYCDLLYGTSLATIHSWEDLNACSTSRYSTDHTAWIGLTDRIEEGVWKWADDSAYDFNVTWYPGEPNDDNDEDCAQFTISDGSFFNDMPCDYSFHQFICNLPQTMAPTPGPTPSPSAAPSVSPTPGPSDTSLVHAQASLQPTKWPTWGGPDVLLTESSGSKGAHGSASISEESPLLIPFIVVCVVLGLLSFVTVAWCGYYFGWYRRIQKLENTAKRHEAHMFEMLKGARGRRIVSREERNMEPGDAEMARIDDEAGDETLASVVADARNVQVTHGLMGAGVAGTRKIPMPFVLGIQSTEGQPELPEANLVMR